MTTTFFFLTPMIYLSGFIFPIENMPQWIQYVTYAIPLRYFLVIVRGIFLKGVGVDVLWPQMAALLACGLVLIDAGHAAIEQAPGVAALLGGYMMPPVSLVPRRHPVIRTAIAVFSLSLPLMLAGVDAAPASAARRPAAVAAASPTSAEIDRDVWAPVSASVANDDIVAMGRSYHPAAVLVTKAGTKPIAAALDGWGKDIVVAKKNGVRATVEFRFASRRDDATTAFETGIFKYTDHRPRRRHHTALCGIGSLAGEARRQVALGHGTSARVDDRGGVERVAGRALTAV